MLLDKHGFEDGPDGYRLRFILSSGLGLVFACLLPPPEASAYSSCLLSNPPTPTPSTRQQSVKLPLSRQLRVSRIGNTERQTVTAQDVG